MRIWRTKGRRFGAGLALIAMLVLALSQVIVIPAHAAVMDCCEDNAPAMSVQAAPASHAGAQTDHGTPHHRGAMPEGAVCCTGGACSALSPMLTPVPTTLPLERLAVTYHEAPPSPPERLGASPPLPPPRFSI